LERNAATHIHWRAGPREFAPVNRLMIAAQRRPLAVVFDLDGVLLDSAPCHRRAFEEVFQPFDIRDFDYRDYAGWKTADVVKHVLQLAGHDADPLLVLELAAEKSRLARECLIEANPVAPGCVPVLERLSKEYPLALASSGSRASIALFLSGNNCAHLFQSVLCGDDVTSAKPDPEIYRRSFASLRVAPANAAVVEDAVAGIQAAHAAGAGTVIGMEGTCSASRLTEAGATAVVQRMLDLPALLCHSYESAVSTKN
jgi:beta-phosphoglucomutase